MSKIDSDKLYLLCLREVYGQLLTEKQRLMLNLFYDLDLSLAEIAQQQNVSRQAVLDCIRKAEEQLMYLERTLCVYDRRCRIFEVCDQFAEEQKDNGSFVRLTEKIRSICE